MMQPAHDRALHAFRGAFRHDPAWIARAPGRVNLIGEHVDYNDGFVLPLAIDLDVVVAAAPSRSAHFDVFAADRNERVRFTADTGRLSGWAAYVQGVSRELAAHGIPVSPAQLAIAGDVPPGAGLSSSAALEAAVALALLHLSEGSAPATVLAELCRRAETDWAGVQCGIMDQFIALLARPAHALLLDCRSLEFRHVPLPHDALVLLIDSGIRRDLTGTAYNQRFEECAAAARLLGVDALRDITLGDLISAEPSLPSPLDRRARHVIAEIERTLEAADALERGDLVRCGALMSESHESLRADFEVSTPELDRLVQCASEVPGIYGARLTGAGFGGCVVALGLADVLEPARFTIPQAYRDLTGRECRVFATMAAPAASTWRVG